MKKITAIFTIILSFTLFASAQFPKMPKMPKLTKVEDANKSTDNAANSTNTTSPVYSNSSSVIQTVPATTILKPTLTVRAQHDARYWKQPDTDNFWSWMPKVAFSVTGPIADASFFTFEFTTPDGKPWFSWDTKPFAVEAGELREIESEAVPYWQDKRSTILTGTFGFKVTLKNNLNGTSQEMYRGTYKVNKKFAGTSNFNFKNQYAFYVEQDWALPIGYLLMDTKQDPAAPRLNAAMWFRGNIDSTRISAHLFYNGKQIANTKSSDQGVAASTSPIITTGDDKGELYWSLWHFAFFNVRANASTGYPDAFVLKNNPGTYEIKVLLDDEIARTATFTVGSDGKVVDNDIAAKNGFSGLGMILPVKVMPGKNGENLTAWKTDAFYGNPLTGFTVQ